MPRLANRAQVFSSYRTNFPATQSPLSENRWIEQDPFYTKVQTIPGFAYGTQVGSGAFDDSNAYIQGMGNDYSVEGTVWLKGGLGTAFREITLCLRWSDTPTSLSTLGYGMDIAWNGAYAEIGTFAHGNIATLVTPPVPVTGDKFKVQIIGQTITYFWNGVAQTLSTGGTSVTDNGPNAVLFGNPGISFFIGAGALNDDFRLQDLTIISL